MPAGRRPPSRIAFFLTGHGFGHAVRQSALMEALPPGVAIDIYSSLPASFFEEELRRPWNLIPGEVDCGCLQADTVEVDVEATLARYAEIDADREALIAKYAALLRDSGAGLLIGDAPPLAFPIARAAGIPSMHISNFTWVDIYRSYVATRPGFLDMLRRMEADYAQADRRARIHPFMSGSAVDDDRSGRSDDRSGRSGPGREPGPSPEDVGMLCRPGTPRRNAFAERFDLDPSRKWCLVYVGSFGLKGVRWGGLAAYRDWEFLGLYPLEGAPTNYRLVQKDSGFSYADLLASCDLVLGKLGYGLVTECLAQGKPVLYMGRNDFDEYPMLKRVIDDRAMGWELPLARFKAVDLRPELDILTVRPHPTLEATGVVDILRKIGF